MKSISIDIQPLLKNRTGIGWYAYNIIKWLLMDKDNVAKYYGTGFDFLNRNNAINVIDDLKFDDVILNSLIPARVYKLLWRKIPVEYNKLVFDGDLYHFFNYITPPIARNKKVVINVYDMVYRKYPETMKKSNRYLLHRDIEKSIYRADKIITISENSKKEILEYFNIDEDKIDIISPGIDYSYFDINEGYRKEKMDYVKRKYGLPDKFFLYFGTLEPRKNIVTILKAYAELPQNIQIEYKMVLCGGRGWGVESIDATIEKLDLKDNVVFTGYVNEEDKAYIYNKAKVFLFPSLYEGFGMPILEAMASRTPVITSNISSMPEAGGDAAFYVAPMDYLSISKEIKHLLIDKNHYKNMVNKGVQHVKRFSWENAAKQTLALYKELLSD